MTPAPPAYVSFLTDEDGNVASWNEPCTSLFGLAAGQVLGRSMCILLADGGGPECGERWRELAQQAQSAGLPVDMRCVGGKTWACMLCLAPQHDKDGNFAGCIAALTVEFETDTPDAAWVGRTPLSKLIDLFPGTMYAINAEGRFVLWNRTVEKVAEMASDQLAAANVLDMVELPDRPRIADAMRRVFERDEQIQLEADCVARSGRTIPLLLCGVRVAAHDKQFLVGVGLDISERRAQEEKLRLSERALHAASNGIVITRCAGKENPIEYVNPAFERITGYSADEVVGRDSRFMAAPGLDLNERAQVREAIAQRRAASVVFRNQRKDGELFWNDLSITPVQDEHGDVTHFIGVLVDVTARKQRTARLEHEVNHDALTGLANRNLLWDRLEQALHMAQRNKTLVAAVLIDLNNFKSINDSLGHEAGDVVLKVVAKRLQASVRESDTVARLAGDEFVLVLVNQPSLRFTLRMIERLRTGLTMPVSFNRREIPVGASVGVAVYPGDGATAAELVRAADVAMYHAKSTGKTDIQFFSADLKASTEAKQRLESGMREAVGRNELFMLYQPRIDAGSGKVRAFEALLRWRHPEHGVMLPPSFLAEAEENGCIVQIGNWVLDQACAFLRELRDLGFNDLPVSVNVSHREYSHHDFVPGIAGRLARFGLPAGSLQLELREDSLIRNPGLGRDLAAQLRALGLPLSVDEFGTGISDLGYLQALSAGQVKLAKAAVHAIDKGGGNAIAKTLIDIGHNLNMGVVAEAVETRAQMDFLKAHGCDQMQGMLLSEPLEPEAARQLLAEHA